jgi:cobyric acid synthase
VIRTGGHLHVLSTTPASGKTVITTGLIRALRDRGHVVLPFKPVVEATASANGAPEMPASVRHQCFAAAADVAAEISPIKVIVDRREAEVWLFDERIGRVPMLGRDMPVLGLLDDEARHAVAVALGNSLSTLADQCDILVSEGSGAATALLELGLTDPANIDVGSTADQILLVARASSGTAFTTVDRVIAVLHEHGVDVSGFLLNDVPGCVVDHDHAARRAADRCGVEYVGAMPWTDFFEYRPKHEPPSPGCDEDHAHLADLVTSTIAMGWDSL